MGARCGARHDDPTKPIHGGFHHVRLTHGLGSLYRQDAPLHHEDADLVATSVPYKLMIPRWQAATKLMKENGAEERTDGWMAAFPIYL